MFRSYDSVYIIHHFFVYELVEQYIFDPYVHGMESYLIFNSAENDGLTVIIYTVPLLFILLLCH
jgi:hypothetical protein